MEYAPNPNHRRAKLVCFTERGRKAFRELSRRQQLWANEIASGVRPSEIQVALAVLRKLKVPVGGWDALK